MSILESLEHFRGAAKVILNQKYIDDKSAKQVAKFLQSHGKVQCLQLKSNDISGIGFCQIFKSLSKNPSLRQLIIEYNRLGEEAEDAWPEYFAQMVQKCGKLERLNFSNNKINARGFAQMRAPICYSKSLRLLELRYNQISSGEIGAFVDELERAKNQSLLYVQLAGNKIDKDVITRLQNFLKANKEKNPIPKDNLMMTGGFHNTRDQRGFQSQNSFSRTNAIDDLSKQNVLRHLQNLLDQSRRGTTELKNRLQEELAQLQRKEKMDADEILNLDRKCNELTISNRNLNYQIQRTLQQHKQIQQDHEYQARVKEQRIQQANRELNELQSKYEEIENKMVRDHEAKMKEISRTWEARLRGVEDKIRNVEADASALDNELQKTVHKREKLRADYQQQESLLRSRIQQQQSQRYKLKLKLLQSRITEVEVSRQKFYKRGQDILYELEHGDKQDYDRLENELQELKLKEKDFVAKNKESVSRNEMIKQDISLKEIAIEKMEEQINRLNEEIELRKTHNNEQITKIIQDHETDRLKKGGEKENQIQKLNNIESTLRTCKLENAKLAQEYQILEHRLQMAVSKGVQEVFAENNLY